MTLLDLKAKEKCRCVEQLVATETFGGAASESHGPTEAHGSRVPLLQHIAFRSVDPRSWSTSLRLNGRQAVRWAQHLAQSMPRVLGELAELIALLMPPREPAWVELSG